MGKMKDIAVTLAEYEDYLHEMGHNDPMVKILKKELMNYGPEVRDEVKCIDETFDQLVFNNQTEGRF